MQNQLKILQTKPNILTAYSIRRKDLCVYDDEGGRWRRGRSKMAAVVGGGARSAGAFAGVDAGEMVGPSGRANQCKTI